MLTFDKEKHEYRWHGAIVPSVTHIISPLVEYSKVNPDLLQRAADYGRNVHEMIRLWIEGTLDEERLDPLLVPPLEAFIDWYFNGIFAEVIKKQGIICEQPIYNRLYGYAGTPDIIIYGVAVVDIKTRPVNKVTDSLQLEAYMQAHIENSGTKAPYGRIVLQLESCPITGKKYKETEVGHKKAWPMFRAMLDNFKEQKEFQKKLEGWRQLWK